MHELARSVEAAVERVAAVARRTPVLPSTWLTEETGAETLLKLENLQLTGSFKIRGATNKVLGLAPEQARRGVVAASTGNHGLAVTRAARRVGVPATIHVPTTASPRKVEALRRAGATVVVAGEDAVEGEVIARRSADDRGACYVSPYNDLDVIAGQGTLGLELTEQTAPLDAVLVAVGGGGLVAGVAAAVKSRWPGARVVGCSPEASPVLRWCVEAGRVVQAPTRPTLSDATAGGVEEGSVTVELCAELVDTWWDVAEDDIRDALLRIVDEEHLVVEGAAAVPVAALRRHADELRGHRVGIVVCGGNIGLDTLAPLRSAG